MVGPTSQQDVELSALYRDSVITYGDGKVLGILATKTTDHSIRKRATPDENPGNPEQATNQVANTPNQINEPETTTEQTNFVYYPGDQAPYKILLYTSTVPELCDPKNCTKLYNSVSLTITTDRRNDTRHVLKVRYNYKGERVSITTKNSMFKNRSD